MFNNPISFIDPDGRAPDHFIVKDEADQTKVKDALATAFNGNTDAFSFGSDGKLSIDREALGDLSSDQQFIYDSFNEGIVENSSYDMVVELSDEGVTSIIPNVDSEGNLSGHTLNLNINQSDFDAKMRDTEDGNIKQGDSSYEVTDTDKRAIAIYHEIGHSTEMQKGNAGVVGNNRSAVGYENVYRNIVGFSPRVGKLHGQQKSNGKYKKRYQGSAPPTGYKKE